jgi:glucoamylase
LKRDTPSGPCWRRYNHDGYGQKKDGGPYEGWGQGRAWPLLTGERAHYELAAGGSVTPLISAFEKFSSIGGMLPEQVWDYADLPSEGMYFGKSAGSAQPLVWAHSEYLKLLRSATDKKVFDRISAVEERYAVPAAKRSFSNQVEIFQLVRPVAFLPAGFSLRVVDGARFRIVYSFDQWSTVNSIDARSMGRIGYFADIPTSAKQYGSILFTLCWPNQGPEAGQSDRWLGKNLEVTIVPASSGGKS